MIYLAIGHRAIARYGVAPGQRYGDLQDTQFRDASHYVRLAATRSWATIAHEPDLPPRSDNPPPALMFAFDGGYARRTRRGLVAISKSSPAHAKRTEK